MFKNHEVSGLRGTELKAVLNDLRKFHYEYLTRNASIQLPKKEANT